MHLSPTSKLGDRQTDRQTDRNVYLTKINKIHKIIFRKNCGRETSTKTIYSRSRGGHPVTYHNS